MSADGRISAALAIAMSYSQVDGAHHKAWAIDQMVRALTACPRVTLTAMGARGVPYSYETYGESDEYRRFIAVACDGDDGPDTYGWDAGTPA